MSRLLSAWILAVLCLVSPALAQTELAVVNAGPTGELGSLEQANEIRIRFSEPMVTLGRIPDQVEAPFLTIAPAIRGTFRWAGPTILVFTPSAELPNATTYRVTVAATATAISGRRLRAPHTFTFTTPTVRLLRTEFYRENGRYDGPLKIIVRFNQPVRTADVLAHAILRYQPHDWNAPVLDARQRARMGAAAVAAFDRKVADVSAVARSRAAVPIAAASAWDRERYPANPAMAVLQTSGAVSPGGHLELVLDRALPSMQGPATPAALQTYTIELAPAFFIRNFDCRRQCDADGFNAARIDAPIDVAALRQRVTVRDVTATPETVVAQSTNPPNRTFYNDEVSWLSLEEIGYAQQPPSRTYAVSVDAAMQAKDGQVLGYTYVDIVENWHMRAFTSFGDGHGVWEKSGGPQLPFYARNLTSVTQWAAPLRPADLMPTMLSLQADGFHNVPSNGGVARRLGVTPDVIQSHGLDLSRVLQPNGTGLVWTAVQPGEPIAQSRPFGSWDQSRASIVQVTNLGINVKDSPANTLVFVTRLDNAQPVAGATITIVGRDNQTRWTGETNAQGIVLAPSMKLRSPRRMYETSFIVTAAKDGDLAYVASDWNEGISPWEFGTGLDLYEAEPLLRGTVFTDRGVYRPGEEVHFKAIVRADAPTGIEPFKAGTLLHIQIRDSRNQPIDRRTVSLNAWSTGEWTMRLPSGGSLGDYQIVAALEPSALDADHAPSVPYDQQDDTPPFWKRQLHGSFLVAAYRRPDFRVDATLTSDRPIGGSPLTATITARYLFGGAMGKRPVRWTLNRAPMYQAPPAVGDRYPFSRFAFVGCCDEDAREDDDGPSRPFNEQIAARSAELDARGELRLTLESRSGNGFPYQYTLEGDVEDVSRQHIANRASLTVHPADIYIGLQRPTMFVEQRTGLNTTVVAVTPAGVAVPGTKVDLQLLQVQWHSVRRAEGSGFYAWETERKEIEVAKLSATSGAEPVPVHVPTEAGGYYILKATAHDADGRIATTRLSFYAIGTGYTAWQRFDHNRIELLPDRESYKPGDTAKLMIKSPWEQATALLTVEREGIRSFSQFMLTSTQQTVDVPIAAKDIPNVFVSVLLVKGRTVTDDDPKDASDPGKPAFRLGYAKLTVEDGSKRLAVTVKSNREEFKPAGTAKVDLTVKDAAGAGTASEVTVWAVDYGVLSLTAFRTPDVLGSIYMRKALQVMNEDNRERIISRRVLTPKGTADGGGGGEEAALGALRKDFRALAFWLGSVTTDGNGRASISVKLPESLTTYRIMAVAGDRSSRFGSGESEIRINKPVVLQPAFPRFLTRGDSATFGAVVTSQLKNSGSAQVVMRSLDPSVLSIAGDGRQTVNVPAGGSVEVRFPANARGVGRARVQMSVRLGGQTDGFEDAIPVEIIAPSETVAAYGEASPEAKQTLAVPNGVIPGFGGLRVELASTALVGLNEGARYVVEYPYGCIEQRSSRAFVMMLAADLGDTFKLSGIDPRDLKARTQSELRELERFQCPSGGFAFWPGACIGTSPFFTSYVMQVYQQGAALGYTVDKSVMDRAYGYLERELAATQPANEGWWPSYTAWQAFSVKILAEAGRNQDSNINRLSRYLDRMPVFAITYLHDALAATRPNDPRLADLRRRSNNAMLPEAGSIHVEELNDPYLLYFWNSNVRSTSIALSSMVKTGDGTAQVPGMVRWLMGARKDGRWGNTQENALAMQALVTYYRKYESQTPGFTASIRLGTEELVRETFKGRSTTAVTRDVPLARVAAAGSERELTFRREGEGTLFYAARLSYTRELETFTDSNQGFKVGREYALMTDGRAGAPANGFKAGDLIQVTVSLDLPKERRYVAVTDPLPAGTEAVESWFATTAAQVARGAEDQDQDRNQPNDDWQTTWRRGTFDHVERHDDRVLLFATRLAEGHHEFSYVVRATTAGTFKVAPTQAEEMYSPEVFGRNATVSVEIKP